MEMTVQVIHCYGGVLLVGVNGKEVFGTTPASSGKMEEDHYISFSSQQMSEAAAVKELYPCPTCGEAVPVKSVEAIKQ
jgi:hypothetical protein